MGQRHAIRSAKAAHAHQTARRLGGRVGSSRLSFWPPQAHMLDHHLRPAAEPVLRAISSASRSTTVRISGDRRAVPSTRAVGALPRCRTEEQWLPPTTRSPRRWSAMSMARGPTTAHSCARPCAHLSLSPYGLRTWLLFSACAFSSHCCQLGRLISRLSYKPSCRNLSESILRAPMHFRRVLILHRGSR